MITLYIVPVTLLYLNDLNIMHFLIVCITKINVESLSQFQSIVIEYFNIKYLWLRHYKIKLIFGYFIQKSNVYFKKCLKSHA